MKQFVELRSSSCLLLFVGGMAVVVVVVCAVAVVVVAGVDCWFPGSFLTESCWLSWSR